MVHRSVGQPLHLQNCNELVDSSKFLFIKYKGESKGLDPSKSPAKIPMLFQDVGVPELPAQKDMNYSVLSFQIQP